MRLLRAICWVSLLSGCTLAPLAQCAFLCDAHGACAAGHCGDDGYCHAEGDTTHCGSDGGVGTDGGGACTGCASGGPYNYAFASSASYVPGTFDGLDGADLKCQTLADAAGLPGTFRAWLSSSSVDARSRFSSARGWVRPDGRPFTDSIGALVGQGQIFYPLRLDERGRDLIAEGPYPMVATGTHYDGTHDAQTSSDWTSTTTQYQAGNVLATSGLWTEGSPQTGTLAAHIYCLATDLDRALTIAPAAGRLAFLSSSSFTPSSVSAADTQCQSDAQLNSMSGTYRALLSTTTASAASRFDLSGPIWVRVDGIPLLAAASDLAMGTLLTSLGLRPGMMYTDYAPAWTGAATPMQTAANMTQSCSDWTAASSSETAVVGRAEFSSSFFFKGDITLGCNASTASVYCLQE